ncbi:MAG TPA: hypothetical protein VMR77_02545 [Patescibacteria group bacterium]|jgi:hypothetical protein|nr:hypothetical protein [Patescibacteria group bacterium]
MSEGDNPQKKEAERRARLIGEIRDGIKSFVQEDDPQWTERLYSFYPEPFETTYAYSEGNPPTATLTIREEVAGEETLGGYDQEIKYLIAESRIIKRGFYDFREVNGEPPVDFVPSEELAEERESRPWGIIQLSPEVSLAELRLLCRIVKLNLAAIRCQTSEIEEINKSSLNLIRKLPFPNTWKKCPNS